jgi:hypothetical protein
LNSSALQRLELRYNAQSYAEFRAPRTAQQRLVFCFLLRCSIAVLFFLFSCCCATKLPSPSYMVVIFFFCFVVVYALVH